MKKIIPVIIVVVIASVVLIYNFASHRQSESKYASEGPVTETSSLERKEYKDPVKIKDISQTKQIKVCSVDMKGDPEYYSPDKSEEGVNFLTDLSFKEIAESNIEGYVGPYKYVAKGNVERKDGMVFFVDNNYYHILKVMGGAYSCELLASEFKYKDGFVRIFTPMSGELNWAGMYPFLGLKVDALPWINLYSTEEILEFYGRLSPKMCKVNEEEQTVLLNGYYFYTDEDANSVVDLVKDVALIDCKNKRIYLAMPKNKINVFERRAHYTLDNPDGKPMNDDSLKVMKSEKKSIWCKDFSMSEDGMWECEKKKYGFMTTITYVDEKDPFNKKPQFILLSKSDSISPTYEECENSYALGKATDDYVVVSKDSTIYR
ncbi:MAG: hypothetical protein K6G63_02595 [Eubacterium sp.]|nr:hypothetical protein [Eubacterium sp.]